VHDDLAAVMMMSWQRDERVIDTCAAAAAVSNTGNSPHTGGLIGDGVANHLCAICYAGVDQWRLLAMTHVVGCCNMAR